jgi:hypothetical protein
MTNITAALTNFANAPKSWVTYAQNYTQEGIILCTKMNWCYNSLYKHENSGKNKCSRHVQRTLKRTSSICVLSFLAAHEAIVPSIQKKSSGMKFSKSRTGSHVTYSSHHNSSRFTFPVFVNSWRFSLPFITINHAAYILTKDTNTFA